MDDPPARNGVNNCEKAIVRQPVHLKPMGKSSPEYLTDGLD